MVIVSDDAGQFAVGQHAPCWVHADGEGLDGAGVIVVCLDEVADDHDVSPLVLLAAECSFAYGQGRAGGQANKS